MKKMSLLLAALIISAGTCYANEITGDVTFGTEMESFKPNNGDAANVRFAPFVSGGFNFSEYFRLGYTLKSHHRNNDNGEDEKRGITEIYPKLQFPLGKGSTGAELTFAQEVDSGKNRQTFKIKPFIWQPINDKTSVYAEVLFGTEPNFQYGDGTYLVNYTETYGEVSYKLSSKIGLSLAGKYKIGSEYGTTGDKVQDVNEVILMPKISYDFGGTSGNAFYRMEIRHTEGDKTSGNDWDENAIRFHVGYSKPLAKNISGTVEAYAEPKTYSEDTKTDSKGTNRFLALKISTNF